MIRATFRNIQPRVVLPGAFTRHRAVTTHQMRRPTITGPIVSRHGRILTCMPRQLPDDPPAGAQTASDTQLWAAYRYEVVDTTAVTPVIRELWLAPRGRAMSYSSGQYVLLGDVAHRLPPRAYSLANAPRADGKVSLLVTRFSGGPMSGWVHGTLRVGDEVVLDGPYGTFVPGNERDSPVLLLAAGSGLAPIRALAEDFLAEQPARRATLFFSARTAADTIDHARFQDWTRRFRGFRYLLTLTRDPAAKQHRRIPELLPHTYADLRGWEVFVAGPTGFVVDCAERANALGAVDVHTEEFFADPEPWADRPPVVASREVNR